MSEIMLDTCALIWLGNGDSSLSLDARQEVEETEVVYVSPVSLWEISNKYRQGKLSLNMTPREWFSRVCSKYRLSVLPLSADAMFLAGEFPEYHKDPADRMIIASAKCRGLRVVTGDRNFPLYGVDTIC